MQPGTGTIVTDEGGLELHVPPSGAGVGTHEYGPGGSETLVLERSPLGVLNVASCGSEGEASGSGGSGACNDDAFNLEGHKWFDRYHWRFSGDSTPGEITKNNAEEGFKDGVKAITQANNNCGLTDNVSATQTFDGRTTRRADMNGGRCQSFANRDGVSVADFGDVAKLAKACWWFFVRDPGRDDAVEGDIRLDKADHPWVGGQGGAGCTNKWSVRATTAHEAGHVFGIAHVSEREHGNLTMSKKINGPCQDSEFTLGLGDVRGLRQLY